MRLYCVCYFKWIPLKKPCLQGISPLLGEGTQVVPLVTDALAAGVDRGGVMVVKLTADSEVSAGAE